MLSEARQAGAAARFDDNVAAARYAFGDRGA
jgi:hypothetical protein